MVNILSVVSNSQQNLEKPTANCHRQKKRRRRRHHELKCGVCGLPAKSIHFGGAACDSCKVFFRRSIQKGTYSHFLCKTGGQCTETPLTQRRCAACRFSKCLQNGMDPKWVMTKEERQNLRQTRLNRGKLGNTAIQRMYNPDPKDLCELLTEEEMATVRTMVVHFKHIVSQVLHENVAREVSREVGRNTSSVTLIAFGMMNSLRLQRFACDLPEFASLKSSNRDLLMRTGLMQMHCLRGMYEFDVRRRCWPNDKAYDRYPVIRWDDHLDRMSAESLRKFETYCENVLKLQMDEPCTLLLMTITLLTTDNRFGLTEKETVQALQDRFLSILRKYVEWRYGALSVSVVYPKLLGILTDVQEAVTYCNEKHNWMHDYELDYMERKLGSLNPFHEYSLEKRDQLFVPATVDPYGVLEDSVPTIDMLHRGTLSLCQGVDEEQGCPQLALLQEESSSDSSDLFSIIEDMDKTEEEISSNSRSSSPWSPDDFDLSFCQEILL